MDDLFIFSGNESDSFFSSNLTGRVLALLAAEQENTACQATEDEDANAHTSRGLFGLHFLECDCTENDGQNGVEAKDHAENDEYFCCSSHYIFSLIKFIQVSTITRPVHCTTFR